MSNAAMEDDVAAGGGGATKVEAPAPVSAEDEARATQLKDEGNEFFKGAALDPYVAPLWVFAFGWTESGARPRSTAMDAVLLLAHARRPCTSFLSTNTIHLNTKLLTKSPTDLPLRQLDTSRRLWRSIQR